MTEKRRLKRVQLSQYLNVFDTDKNELVGQVLDIHVEGFLIMNDKYLEPGDSCNLKFVFPKEFTEADQMLVRAEIVWTAKEFEPGFNHTGFRFLDSSSKNTRVIETLIKNYGR